MIWVYPHDLGNPHIVVVKTCHVTRGLDASRSAMMLRLLRQVPQEALAQVGDVGFVLLSERVHPWRVVDFSGEILKLNNSRMRTSAKHKESIVKRLM